MVLGPSGVGKSTLIYELKKGILNEMMVDLEKDKSIFQFVSVELIFLLIVVFLIGRFLAYE